MLPFGKVKEVSGTQAQVLSRLLAGFEEAGCEVERDGDTSLSVLIPSWDSQLLPFAEAVEIQQLFWDRMRVKVDAGGGARYQMAYFSGMQLLLHLLITAAFAWEAWFGTAGLRAPMQFVLTLAAAHLVPAAVTLANFHLSRRALFRKVLN
jgi:hypothetical protein